MPKSRMATTAAISISQRSGSRRAITQSRTHTPRSCAIDTANSSAVHAASSLASARGSPSVGSSVPVSCSMRRSVATLRSMRTASPPRAQRSKNQPMFTITNVRSTRTTWNARDAVKQAHAAFIRL